MTKEELGEYLYSKYWRRNTKNDEDFNKVDKFANTAIAIQLMWINIAADAISVFNDNKR